MLITLNNTDTAPAKEYPALRAYHFVAAICLLNLETTFGAWLCAGQDVHIIEHALDIVQLLSHSELLLFFDNQVDFLVREIQFRAPFKEVILFLAVQAKAIPALNALSIVLLLVYFGRCTASTLRTPGITFHFVYSFAEGELLILLDQVRRQIYLLKILGVQ